MSEPVLPKIIMFSQINIQGLMKRQDIDSALKLLKEKLDKICKFCKRNSEVKSTEVFVGKWLLLINSFS